MAIPLVLGVLACLLVTGGPMLWPGNVNWLTHSDLAQSYLGWAFYRQAPWTWPPGANPGFGAGLHASIYYSDSIPLLAMLFKPLASWLPEPFQYFGLWVLACFALQAWFAWRLLGLATTSVANRSLGTLFFVLAPPMLARLAGHMALVGHWTLLAAIYLCLRPSRRHQAVCWAALTGAAMIIHAYLFAMVGALWVADMAQRHRMARGAASADVRVGFGRWLPELALVVGATVAVAWLSGFFMVSGHGMQADGFGYYKMNLLAPINGDGWSRFGLNFPQATGEYEGFNYLGLGGIALIVAAWLAVALRRDLPQPRILPRPLVIIAALLGLLAITCNVGVGAMQWHVPLPRKWWDALSHLPLQSTGRLFWVPYYLWLLWALFVLLRVFRGRWRTVALAAAVLLQLADLYPGLSQLRSVLVARSRDATVGGLQGPFWTAAGNRYRTLRQWPLALMAPGWEQLALYAQNHHMETDAVQLARVDWNRFLSLYNDQQEALLGDRLDPDTLYVLSDREVAVARIGVPRAQAALFRLDGRNVLAPGWHAPLPAGAVDLRGRESATSPFGVPFQSDFTQNSAGRLLLGQGWNSTDAGAASSRFGESSLFVPGGSEAGRTVHVELRLHRASTGKNMAQRLEVWMDGSRIGGCELTGDDCRQLELEVPGDRQGGYFRKLVLRSEQPEAKLRIALDEIRVSPAD